MPLHDPAHAFVPYPDTPVASAATGPLAELRFAAKDLFDVAGYPTGGGSPFLLAMSGIKTQTAPTVQKLLDAGARFVGKTVTDELAFSMNGNNAHFGAPLFARVGAVLLGDDPAPLPDRVRLLRPTDVWALVEEPVAEALAPALARVETVAGAATQTSVALESWDAMYWNFRYLQGRESWLTNGPLIERFAPPLGPGVAERFAWSREVTDAQVTAARAFRVRFRNHLAELLGEGGVLVMPTMPDIAPLRSEGEASLDTYRNRAIQMLCIAGLSGFPQISMPLATRNGAPLGLSLLGPAGSDRSLIALAEKIAEPSPSTVAG